MAFEIEKASFQEILAHVRAAGALENEHVTALRARLLADGRITRDEANWLLDLNQALAKRHGQAPPWRELFVEAVANYVLDDPNSPHKIDESEGTWLAFRLGENGEYNEPERALLAHLKQRARLLAPPLKKLIEKLGI